MASQISFVNRAMNTWGFDGFKGDYLWSMPKCYDASHNHAYPEESTEKQAEFYKQTHAQMIANNPDVFIYFATVALHKIIIVFHI